MSFILVLDGFVLIPADDGGDIIGLLFALGPLVAFLFYGATYRNYRNHDKRFKLEESTEVSSKVLQASDIFMNTVTGASHGTMRGANHEDPTTRVGGAERPRPTE